MSTSIQRLGATLVSQMKRTSNAAVPTTIDLGVVNDDLSITPDSLRIPIPKGDYMVNLMLTGEKITEAAGAHAGHGESGYTAGGHSHNLPRSLRGIEPGDRVLIIWSGNEPIVIALLASSIDL